MNIELRKQKLINWIGGLKDDKIVERLETLQNMSDEWAVTTTDFEKRLIDEGLAEIESGKVYSHAQVMEETFAYLKTKK